MIGKIIGAVAGSKLAKSTRGGIDGPVGAVLGMTAASAAKRLSLPALVAITAGGFVLKKLLDKPAGPGRHTYRFKGTAEPPATV